VKLKLELHRQHKLYLLVAGIVFLGAGVGSWFIWKECQELDEQSDTLAGQVVAAKQRIAGIDDLEDKVIVLRENVESYVRVLPSDAEVNDFYRTLNAFSRDAGVEILDLKPQPNRTKLQSSAVFDKAEYKLKINATYAQLLQFIGRLENHERFVSFAEIKIQAGDASDKEQKDQTELRHTINLTLVTYVYLGDDVGKGVPIPAYDRKKDKLSDQIQEARAELALERYQLLSASGRRDPFVDPRTKAGKNGKKGEGPEDQRQTFTKVMDRIQECNKLLDVMVNAGSVIREMELKVQAMSILAEIQTSVDDVNARGGLTDSALKRDWDKKVMPELAKLRSRVGENDSTNTPTSMARQRMQQAMVAMEQHYEAGDYATCVKDYELVRSAVTESADPEIVQMQSRMEQLYLAAQTAVEFSRKKLEVSGLVVEQGAESVAIINHNVYRAGDAIEDDLILLEIHEDHLKFEYKGVALVFDL
jgi:Tfp pilus assembly protein PilO